MERRIIAVEAETTVKHAGRVVEVEVNPSIVLSQSGVRACEGLQCENLLRYTPCTRCVTHQGSGGLSSKLSFVRVARPCWMRMLA